MTPDERLDQVIQGFRDADIPDGPPPEVVAQTLAALQRENLKVSTPTPFRRLQTMSVPIRIAAALLLAAGIIGIPNVLTSNRTSPGVVFAAVVAQVKAARTVSYTLRVGEKGEPIKISLREPGLVRTEMPGGGLNITDRVKGKNVVLDPVRKTAMVFALKPAGTDGPGMNPIDHLRNFRGKPDADLGVREIDGRTARGFRFTGGGHDNVVWVDTQNNLPVRMENKSVLNAGGVTTFVLNDFVFDAPLDEALFSTTPPEGYKIQTVALPKAASAPVEKDLVDLFGEYAERSGGRFPADLQMGSLLDVLKDIKVTKDGMDEATNAWVAKIGQGVGLIWAMPPASDALYTGKDVKPGQADRPVFRYRPQGSPTYRVIYGDLTVKDVKPEDISR